MMVEGDKWKLYIPYDLAYGERGILFEAFIIIIIIIIVIIIIIINR